MGTSRLQKRKAAHLAAAEKQEDENSTVSPLEAAITALAGGSGADSDAALHSSDQAPDAGSSAAEDDSAGGEDDNEGSEEVGDSDDDNDDDDDNDEDDSELDAIDPDEWPSSSEDSEADSEEEDGSLAAARDPTVKVLRRKVPYNEIDPVYDADDSDEETTNTIGNVPKEWYEDFPHVGYSIDGKPIMKGTEGKKDQLDEFLSLQDDPNAWRSVYDDVEDKDVVLTKEELEMVKRIQKGEFPDATSNPYEDQVEWFSSQTLATPLSAAPEPKRRFVPSKWEAQRIMHIVRAIRSGRLVPGAKKPERKDLHNQSFFDIWGDAIEPVDRGIMHIAAPKQALPHHDESYNPPDEYLPTEEEAAEWKALDAADRPKNYLPRKHENLRSVPGYDRFIQERFDRCLDLYLCPRVIKKKINIDPESLIPKLPNPRDLLPFPTQLSITFKGHKGRIRSFSIDPTGQYMASGSDDRTVRLWDVLSGRCVNVWTFDEGIASVVWNPSKSLSLLAIVSGSKVNLVSVPGVAGPDITAATEALINHIATLQSSPATAALCQWARTGASSTAPIAPDVSAADPDAPPPPPPTRYSAGARLVLTFDKPITYLTWHRKGDYLSTVSPDANTRAVLIHQLTKRVSQNPFKTAKGLVQRVTFHPTKPFFFVATQRFVRVYNLAAQKLATKLQPSTKWISSLAVHPQGDNVIVGTYDKRLAWFDMDLSSKPYKTLRYHKQAIRNVSFHARYPLFASASDDGNVNVFHGMVYSDLLMNPLIVPVKTLRAHQTVDGLGVLHCEFHPTQPWIISSGADGTLKLFS
ncbi:Ribosome biogenesis protein erb1 [Geranomyces michiganensis]|nr:Ribosome biogenesis protein erb1 [Geranomyces michiganensis]